jgi:tetratricopeptide (TPR) repeat protein
MSTGDFSKALNTVEIALKLESDNTDLLYFAAVCSRYLHLYDQALTWLETLKSIIPEHGRAYQEEGYLRRELNQPELALQAFALAWRYNPALESSCRAALELATKLNQPAEIQQVSAQLAALARLPKILIAATDLVAEGKRSADNTYRKTQPMSKACGFSPILDFASGCLTMQNSC